MTSKAANPFGDIDFTRFFGEFRMPGFDAEALIATQRKNFEALATANHLALEGVQAVIRRQGEVVRQMMEETRGMVTDLVGAGAPEDKVVKQTDLVKATFEKTLANMREMSEMLAKSNMEAADKIARRVSESLDELKVAIGARK